MFSYFQLPITDTQYKRKAENDSKSEFDEQWEMSSYLVQVRQGNRCASCVKTLFHVTEDMILTDTIKQHQTEIEGKQKLILGSELGKEYFTKKRKKPESKMYLLKEVVKVWQ